MWTSRDTLTVSMFKVDGSLISGATGRANCYALSRLVGSVDLLPAQAGTTESSKTLKT
jgi:hypothetical protein